MEFDPLAALVTAISVAGTLACVLIISLAIIFSSRKQ